MVSTLDDTIAVLAARLDARAVAMPDLMLPPLELIEAGLPDWWAAGGNRLFAPPGTPAPAMGYAHGPPPTDGVVVLASTTAPQFQLWGEAPMVMLGGGSAFSGGWMNCGGGSTIAIGGYTGCTWNCRVDARNGGVMVAGEFGLWAGDVVIQTDDMHAIRDLAGKRLNPFGGTIEIGRHVWLGLDALVLPGARIGADVVIGARSLVRGVLPANTVCAGAPARVVREGANWAFEDIP